MVAVPNAIIFVNDDLVPQAKAHIQTQLHISQTLDGYEFDAILISDPTFLTDVAAQNRRILVIRPFTELTNRAVADVVIFVKAGMASVLKNKFGPPIDSFPVLRLHWGQFGIF